MASLLESSSPDAMIQSVHDELLFRYLSFNIEAGVVSREMRNSASQPNWGMRD